MYNSCRYTVYCAKCEAAQCKVYFKGSPMPTYYNCWKCNELQIVPKKNIDYIRNYKFQQSKSN